MATGGATLRVACAIFAALHSPKVLSQSGSVGQYLTARSDQAQSAGSALLVTSLVTSPLVAVFGAVKKSTHWNAQAPSSCSVGGQAEDGRPPVMKTRPSQVVCRL